MHRSDVPAAHRKWTTRAIFVAPDNDPMRTTIALPILFVTTAASSQVHDLIGYWHNWDNANAPYMQLDQIDPRYTIIDIAFAEPLPGTSHDMAFSPSGTPQNEFIDDIAALQAQGKRVIISIGGANAAVHLDSDTERDEFVASMLDIITTYGFDGIDIDLEGSSVSSTGGTIAAPIAPPIIRLIDAIGAIGDAFELQYGFPMFLTMAPETAYVQGGMSAFGGIWGAYLPIVDALRDRIDILHVQLYNSGSMYGIDGGIYTQGTADFIVSQTEAVLQGFTTAGGYFAPLPPQKVAIGLPACPSAAGGGYVVPGVLAAAVDHLRGNGPQPGTYTLTNAYPTLRGLMTWSINWDAAPNCAAAYEYAQSFEDLFGISTMVPAHTRPSGSFVRPTLVAPGDPISMNGDVTEVELIDPMGRLAFSGRAEAGIIALPAWVGPGHYIFFAHSATGSAHSSRIVIVAP